MIRYVTGNSGKAREAEEYLGVEVDQVDYDYREIQSDDLETIAACGAREAYEALEEPVLTDDAGLFVCSLEGFPGPYSSYVEDALGIERVWRLVSEEEDRRGSFRVVLAYCDGETMASQPDGVQTFEGRVDGRLVAPRGDGGFGYDPIFEYDGTTMAEMDTERKNAVSHRGRAMATFADWYEDHR